MSILFFLLGTALLVLLIVAVRRRSQRRETQRSTATIRRLETVCRLHPDELAQRLGEEVR